LFHVKGEFNMKTKNLWKYVLSGVLLTSMPLCVSAADTASVTIPRVTTATLDFAPDNYWISAGKAGTLIRVSGANEGVISYGSQETKFGKGTGTLTLQGVTVTSILEPSSVAGVVVHQTTSSSLSDKTININDITLDGSAGEMYGFLGYTSGSGSSSVPFNGTLKIGNVSVTNKTITYTEPDEPSDPPVVDPPVVDPPVVDPPVVDPPVVDPPVVDPPYDPANPPGWPPLGTMPLTTDDPRYPLQPGDEGYGFPLETWDPRYPWDLGALSTFAAAASSSSSSSSTLGGPTYGVLLENISENVTVGNITVTGIQA
jgi:hypothetical protein